MVVSFLKIEWSQKKMLCQSMQSMYHKGIVSLKNLYSEYAVKEMLLSTRIVDD